jgi:hypothetical protein
MEKDLMPNSEEFFKKYGFTLSIKKSHPVYEDAMHFTGLEADYVSSLERENERLRELFEGVMANNERLISRESYRLHDEIKKLKYDKENK